MNIKNISIDEIQAFVFDFDGVLTDNFVYTDQNGKETVKCSREDGLAFDVLKKLKKPSFIISTEKNPVVEMRASKLKINSLYGVLNKAKVIKDLAKKNNYNLKNIFYVGNDINDYHAMKICGYTACPADSHIKIKTLSDIILNKNGGEGVIRNLIEDVFNIDFIKTIY